MLGPPTLIEIAVYAAIISGSKPLTCFQQEHARVTCSNGLVAEIESLTTIAFSNGITVDRKNGFPVFSDGTRSWLDSAGRVTFSSGAHVRRINAHHFTFSSGIECRTLLPSLVECK